MTNQKTNKNEQQEKHEGKTKRPLLEKIFEPVNKVRRFVVDVLVLMTVIFTGVLFYLEFQNKSVVIASIEVPGTLSEAGYSSNVIRNKLYKSILDLQEMQSDLFEILEIQDKITKDFKINLQTGDFVVPGTGFSIFQLTREVKKILGAEGIMVQGEIVINLLEGGDATKQGKANCSVDEFLLELTITANKGVKITKPVCARDVDELARKGAIEILRETDPLFLAFCFFENLKGRCESANQDEADKTTLLILSTMIENEDKEIKKWGHMGIGLLEISKTFFMGGPEEIYEKALLEFEKAIETDPNFSLGHYILGSILKWTADDVGTKSQEWKQQVYKEAAKEFEIAYKLNPKFESVYETWGELLLEDLEDYEGARKVYLKWLRYNKKDAFIFSQLAQISFELGKYRDADRYYFKATQIEPLKGEYYLKWGNFLCSLGRNEEAKEKYKKRNELINSSKISCDKASF